MLIGSNNFGDALFAWPNHENELRQIWTESCPAKNDWIIDPALEAEIKRCEDVS